MQWMNIKKEKPEATADDIQAFVDGMAALHFSVLADVDHPELLCICSSRQNAELQLKLQTGCLRLLTPSETRKLAVA